MGKIPTTNASISIAFTTSALSGPTSMGPTISWSPRSGNLLACSGGEEGMMLVFAVGSDDRFVEANDDEG